MVEFLAGSPKPLTKATVNKLMQYLCGYQESIAQVCCPPETIVIEGEDALPDVTGHSNLRLLPPDCGLIETESRIRNGENAELLEFPWMAILSYNTSKGVKFNCGGSIINENYILTAAHCIAGTPDPLLGVRVGEYDTSSEKDCEDDTCNPPVQDLIIEKIIPHPQYNTTFYANDIALLRVSKINFTVENAKPICLPTTEDLRDQKLKTAVVTGWGFTRPFTRKASVLQKVALPVQNLSTCIDAYRPLKQVKLSNKQLCVGGTERKDSCGGDSGGPLQVPVHFDGEDRYVQHGIVSIGHAYCGTVGYPGIFTRVASHVKWILDTTSCNVPLCNVIFVKN
ncbi:hypothetical protein NQ318_004011 [Aromia moschata]|uniref:Peptidase S1 domain-containing protein n=1 Tax=Aromia moschata TaxID=1265417 RepID=A0AAV8Z9H5_9CUCU|nr:hypothetical protein NQ318_004011 [Aromia moschata]